MSAALSIALWRAVLIQGAAPGDAGLEFLTIDFPILRRRAGCLFANIDASVARYRTGAQSCYEALGGSQLCPLHL